LWAHLLVHAYCGGKLAASTLEGDLMPVQARWSELIGRRPMPWYAQEQARRGAFAALVGLTLGPGGQWSAMAIGDCCFFQVRDKSLLTAFPLRDVQAFTLQPLLLGSRQIANAELRGRGAILAAEGTWQPGDSLLLMSDALAATFLTHSGPPLAALGFDGTLAGFRGWIHALRASGDLRNDDVSLVWLNLGPDATA
jgi:hypothetical protein